MVSTKKYTVDGNTKSFLSDFIIKSEAHVRVYMYEYNSNCVLECDTLGSHGYYIRKTDAPQPEDLVSLSKYDLIDNRISFYNNSIPVNGLTLWIEIATNSDEFGDVLTTPNVEKAIEAAERAEDAAERAENIELKISNPIIDFGIINNEKSSLYRHSFIKQGNNSTGVIQDFCVDPYTNEIFTLHMTQTPVADGAVINKYSDYRRTTTSSHFNSSPDEEIGHQGFNISYDKDGQRWFWSGASIRENYYQKKVLRFQIEEGTGTELNIINKQIFTLYDIAVGGVNTPSISLDGRFLITEGSLNNEEVIRVFDLNKLQNGGAGDYSTEALFEFTFPYNDYVNYPLQSISSDGNYIYIFQGNSDLSYNLIVKVFTMEGKPVYEINDFTIGKDLALGDDSGTHYEMEGTAWMWHNGNPYLSVLIASGDSGSRKNRVHMLGANLPSVSYSDDNNPSFISVGANDFGVPKNEVMRFVGYDGNDDTFDERMTISTTGKIGIGNSSPIHKIDILGSGDNGINIKSTGGGTDDDAYLNLDAFGEGEAIITFFNEGVKKSTIEWFEENSQLNIKTVSGDIDIEPNDELVLRASTTNVRVYKDLNIDGNLSIGGQQFIYDEQDFSPVFNYINAPTYDIQNGHYVRTGNSITVSYEIDVSNFDNTDTSSMHIGLPFPIKEKSSITGSIDYSETTLINATEILSFSSSGDGGYNVFFVRVDGTTVKYNDSSFFNTSGIIKFTIQYIIES